MNPATLDAIEAVTKTDPTFSSRDRDRLLEFARNLDRPRPVPEAATGERPPQIMKRKEAAAMLNCTVRTIDRLAREGSLKRRKLPGRTRGQGFLKSDVENLMENAGVSSQG
jgi:excisionase family DNA binding protein